MLGDIGGLVEGAYRKIFKPLPTQFTTRFWSECPPDAESRVLLGHETDALGLPRVQLDWRLPTDLERTFQRAHELLADELYQRGIGHMTIGVEGSVEKALETIEGSYHQMGTTRMHENPRKGVVDSNCRVHDVSNLFVAGSSVFPAYGHVNPTLTIVALAARLADHVKQVMRH
jgi:choline dehydrogenase-like flavoprotein